MTPRSPQTPLICTAVMAGCLALVAAAAQDATFTVASVKPNASTATTELRVLPTGRLIATNVPLLRLISRGHRLHDTQVIGAPAWVATERFDVDARTAAAPAGGPAAVFPLLQPLLADRFKLRAHLDVREVPAYVLVQTDRDGKRGPQLRPSTADCTQAATLTEDQVRANVRDGWPPCGMTFTVGFLASQGSNGEQLLQLRVRRSGTTMRDFAGGLQESLDRPVVDGTGLEGLFDLEYTYAPQPRTDTGDSPFGAPAPGLFVALEEQLGLKLTSRRTTVPVLVVDTVDRPAPN